MPHLSGHFNIKTKKKRIIRNKQRSIKNKKANPQKSQIQKAAVAIYDMGRIESVSKENGTGKEVK